MIVKCAEPQASSRRISEIRNLRSVCFLLFIIIFSLLLILIYQYQQIEKLRRVQPPVETYIGKPTLCETPLVNAAVDKPAKDTFFRDDIPFGIEEQKLLYDAAEEFDVPFTLALAVIEQETNYRNIAGDGGDSIGYMQIQPRWWRSKMDELGAQDLMEPEDNFRVGCSILSDLLDEYGNEADALTAYNSGRPGTSSYAASVLAIRDRLEGTGE